MNNKFFYYVGSRTSKARSGNGKGISVYCSANHESWELIQTQEQPNPSFLCFDRKQKFLYAVHGDLSQVSSYAICVDGTLSYLNTVSTGGTNPVHLCVDSTNRWLFIANLQTGSVSVIRIHENGTLGGIEHIYFIEGNGGPGYISHPHQVQIDPSGDYLAVSAQARLQGIGQIVLFKIHHTSGKLQQVCVTRSRQIAEPRHCVFSPSGEYCYGVNEKDYTVTQYRFCDGQLHPVQIVSTLKATQTSDGWASGIVIHPTGRFLYTSDRKLNLISIFSIDRQNNRLALLDTVSCGKQPRYIRLSPDSTSLFVANELDDSIQEFPINHLTGELGAPVLLAKTGSPVCIECCSGQEDIAPRWENQANFSWK